MKHLSTFFYVLVEAADSLQGEESEESGSVLESQAAAGVVGSDDVAGSTALIVDVGNKMNTFVVAAAVDSAAVADG